MDMSRGKVKIWLECTFLPRTDEFMQAICDLNRTVEIFDYLLHTFVSLC